MLLALLLALVLQEGSADVGKEGQLAIQAEATLSAASAVHNGINQTQLLADGVNLGWVEAELFEDALRQTGAAVRELERRATALANELEIAQAVDLTGSSLALVAAAEDVLDSLASGGGSVVELAGDDRLDGAYSDMTVLLVSLRDDRVTEVLAAAEGVGRVADAVRFIVVFVIPVGAMLAFRRAARRRREREQLEVELVRQTEINKTKDEFVANLSHELRTPLTGIYGFSLALAESGFDDRDTAQELTEIIVTEAAELSRMVDDLIAAGRLESGALDYDITTVDLISEIEHVVETFRRAGTEVRVQAEVAWAMADRLRLRQVVRNLVSNASKHGGGRVEVATLAVDSHVALFVIDDGPGVPPEIEGRLFSRYVHEGDVPLQEGSVGLGLAIARSFAEGMGGSLQYHRTDDLTCFEVRLPAAPSEPVLEGVAAAAVG